MLPSQRLLVALLLVMAPAPAVVAAPENRATVLSIGDGDTIRVQQGQKRLTVRLACIDAPEMAQAPYGAKARIYLQTRLRLGSSVTLQPQTIDRYGRTVAEVIGEINLGLAMVEDGQAGHQRASHWVMAAAGSSAPAAKDGRTWSSACPIFSSRSIAVTTI